MDCVCVYSGTVSKGRINSQFPHQNKHTKQDTDFQPTRPEHELHLGSPVSPVGMAA